jgi:preprotein translocase subunit YajC
MGHFAYLLGALFAEDAPKPQPMAWLWILMIAIFALYYFVVIRGNRREKSSRDDMLNSMKKNDRVVTIGGIIGTVASTSQDGKEVTLKIDDNVRMKVLRSAIQGPLREQEQKSDGDKSKDRVPEEASK